MLDLLDGWDRDLFIFLNQLHAAALDPIAYYATKTEFWLPLYLYLIFLIFRDHKKEGWFVLAGVAISILLSDQITSSLMKPLFARLRPSHEPTLESVIHLVNGYRGGLYGFASSHAANTVGIALYFYLLMRNRYRLAWLLFVWAGVMSYTRIYLGVHYPGDILFGALVGLMSGYVAFRFYEWLKNRYSPKAAT